MLIKGKAEEVERNGKQLHEAWHMPTVIRLNYYVTIPHKELPLTRRNVMHRPSRWVSITGAIRT